MVEKSFAFYGTRRLNTSFTIASSPQVFILAKR
jgi:hypothetical protein